MLAVDRAARVLGERLSGETARDRERHPVDIPGGRRVRCVDVAMRIDPDDAGPASTAGDARERPDRHRVIAADDERERPAALDPPHALGKRLDDADDLARVARTVVLGLALDPIGHLKVAVVLDRVTECLEAPAQPRIPDRRGSHIDAAPASAEVHRDADDLDLYQRPRALAVWRTTTSPSAGRSPGSSPPPRARRRRMPSRSRARSRGASSPSWPRSGRYRRAARSA